MLQKQDGHEKLHRGAVMNMKVQKQLYYHGRVSLFDPYICIMKPYFKRHQLNLKSSLR